MNVLDGASNGHIFRSYIKTQPGGADAVAQDGLSGKSMRQLIVTRQQLGMGPRRLRQVVVPLEFWQPFADTLLIQKIQQFGFAGRKSYLSESGIQAEQKQRQDRLFRKSQSQN